MTCYTQRDKETAEAKDRPLLDFRKAAELKALLEDRLHVYHGGAVCDTDTRGFRTPDDRDPVEIVVDASEGFIPLWAAGVTLRWRFHEVALLQFENAEEIKAYVRGLMAEGLMLWGDAVPVRFTEAHDAWDFEVVIMADDKCAPNGCTLASAFFPDAGRHELVLYPLMFRQSRAEQVETMAHEFGHIFGLRHFFAKLSEAEWPSEIFGEHDKFTIMNYGPESRMTETDRADLKTLYRLARSGELQDIGGTPVRLVRPFSAQRLPGPALVAAMGG